MNCLGILLLLATINQVLCTHNHDMMHRDPRQQRSSGNPVSPSLEMIRRYCNDWAVEIHGDAEMADRIARRFGFINLGQIGNLKTMYHFQLDINDTIRQDSEYHFLSSRQHGEWSRIGERPDITKSLLQEEMNSMIGYAEQQSLAAYSKKLFTVPSDPEFGNQWSLLNTGQTNGSAGRDLNVIPAWMQGITGKGVVVSVVDDGLERENTDLLPNFDSEASWNFVHNDSDPTPDIYFGDEIEDHGTSCAGEIGMAKSNDHCGAGVAYDCNLGGLKIDLSSLSDLQTADALGHNNSYIGIYSNSWGPLDFGFIVEGPGQLTSMTLANGALRGRGGKGNIYVWAAGNGGEYFDSCAADGYVSSIYTIGVGAADQSGNMAEYDEQCASKMVVTFNHNSDTFTSTPQVTTTSLNSTCTNDFTGTSASTPLVSGVITLVLQANPSLTWRDMQYLIAYTSNPNDLVNGDWRANGAGLRVSHKHGFGAIDAEAMVTRAKRWINVPPQVIARISPSVSSGYDDTSLVPRPSHVFQCETLKNIETLKNMGKPGTARKFQSHTVTFNVDSSNLNNITFLEHVVVTLSLSIQGQDQIISITDLYNALDAGQDFINFVESGDHPKRGDIRVELTSPQGTVSVLLPNRDYDFINDEGFIQWPFMSVHHWGEDPTGQWILSVSFNTTSPTTSVLATTFDITLYGTTETPAAVASIPSTCHPYCARGCSGPTAADCDVCRDYRLNSTLECVTSCPNSTIEQNYNYCFEPIIATTTSTVPIDATTSPVETDRNSSSIKTAYFLMNVFSIMFATALVQILIIN